jgi:hypothetical protein
VMAEVQSFLKMLGEVYGTFGLDYSMALSTRWGPPPLWGGGGAGAECWGQSARLHLLLGPQGG